MFSIVLFIINDKQIDDLQLNIDVKIGINVIHVCPVEFVFASKSINLFKEK